MKYRIRKQDELKPSGVEWLGDIPKDWRIKKLKYFAKIKNGQNQQNVLDDEGTYPIFGSGGIFGKANNYLCDKASVLLGRKGTIDKPIYIDKPFWTVDTMYYTNIFKIANPKFFFYGCLGIPFKLYQYGSAIPSMTQEDLHNINFAFINLIEQQKIANFLDEKSKIFDEAISKKEQLISKLELAKQSLISEVVTGKLKVVEQNSKLQTIKREKDELKPSGVEWLGDIPKDWQVKKLKYFTKLNPNKFNLDEKIKDDIEVSFVPMENIRRGNINLENSKNINSVINGYTFFEENDILIAKVTPCFENHNCAIAKNLKNEIGFGSTELNVLRCFNKDSIKFVYYYIQTDLFINLGVSQMTGTGGLKRVPSSFFENFKISFPTITEQQKISKYLDEKLIHFDNTIEKTKQSITKLKEAKEVLISQAVTGKIEVL